MDYYPLFIKLKNRPCLVVGGGEVALRKVRLLAQSGAQITVLANDFCEQLVEEFADQVTLKKLAFDEQVINNQYQLIIAATNNADLNKRIAEIADQHFIPVNVVDQPDLCRFITPAMIDRSPLQIAISSGGAAPVFASYLRNKLEALIPNNYGQLIGTLNGYRSKIKKTFPDARLRLRFWQSIINGPIAEQLLSAHNKKNFQQAEQNLQAAIDSPSELAQQGHVALVGAGPGDPDLLTFRAMRLLQQADVVLYDRLVSPRILNLARRDAERIYVGKQLSQHSVPQGQINQLLTELALQGKQVVRLKGGDPFIFGRGGEEIAQLVDAKISVEVIPGVTAASGCSAYAGIPLTHRDYAQSCLFVTGHLKDNTVNLDWQQMVIKNQTVVIYMGLIGLPTISKKMIEHGADPTLPVALIEQGTTPNQRVFTADLNTINQTIDGQDVHAPTLIIIGSVVNLYQQLT